MVGPVSELDSDSNEAVDALEVDLLLEALYRMDGCDFRGYQRSRVTAKLHGFMRDRGLPTLSSLQGIILRDGAMRDDLLRALTVRASVMFDDASQMAALRQLAMPLLRSFAHPNIWLAECSAAEEVFSLAILLDEEGLLERCRIFVTASNDNLLQEARAGRISLSTIDESESNYRESGGKRSLGDYWAAREGEGEFVSRLRSNITWAQYDFTTDNSFNEFQLILCRKVLPDFGASLRRRALSLFRQSLARFGILAVDHTTASAIEADGSFGGFSALAPAEGLYRHLG